MTRLSKNLRYRQSSLLVQLPCLVDCPSPVPISFVTKSECPDVQSSDPICIASCCPSRFLRAWRRAEATTRALVNPRVTLATVVLERAMTGLPWEVDRSHNLDHVGMSALGHQRTFRDANVISTLLPITARAF